MAVIHKQELEITDRQVLRMPVDSKILCVQVQRGVLCVWYLTELVVYPTLWERVFYIFGTGHPVDRPLDDYIGTVQMDQFVWHVFAERP